MRPRNKTAFLRSPCHSSKNSPEGHVSSQSPPLLLDCLYIISCSRARRPSSPSVFQSSLSLSHHGESLWVNHRWLVSATPQVCLMLYVCVAPLFLSFPYSYRLLATLVGLHVAYMEQKSLCVLLEEMGLHASTSRLDDSPRHI